MSKKPSPLFTLFFTILLDMLGLGILIPVIPVLLAQPDSPHYLLPVGTSIGTGYIILGLLFACFSFGQFVASPIIGQFSDKLGRKRLLTLSVFGTALGHALFAIGIYIGSIPLLFFARLFAGITGGNIVIAQAAIADITTPENRAKNFGLIGAAFGLGFIIGPFIGGKLADPSLVSWFDAATPFWFASILSLINTFLVIRFFRETNKHINAEGKIHWGRSIKNIMRALDSGSVRPLFVTNFLFQTGFAFYTTFAAVYFLKHFGFTQGTIGNYFAFVGVWIVITQAIITRVLSKKFTEAKILEYTIFLAALCIIGIVLSPESTFLYMIAPFFAIGIGLTQANMTALISRSAGAEIQGEVLGINSSVMALAQTIPPLISGAIAAFFEPQAPLIIASLLVFVAGGYFLGQEKKIRRMVGQKTAAR